MYACEYFVCAEVKGGQQMSLLFTPYSLNQGLLLNSGFIDWLRFMVTELRDPPSPFKAVLTDTQHFMQLYPSAREADSGSYAFVEHLPTEISL